jgi:hypothetical protein
VIKPVVASFCLICLAVAVQLLQYTAPSTPYRTSHRPKEIVQIATVPNFRSSGPGGPILVISKASNPFTTYLAEILRAEGLNEFALQDIETVSSSTLAAYDVVILGDMPLTKGEARIISSWVVAGGNLIAMHPDRRLAALLGLVSNSATLSNAYLKVDTSSGPGAGIVGETIQFHGMADLYQLHGASAIAQLYATATTPTAFPAVTLNRVGAGQAAAFVYDLARSVVYTRQGNPAWSGERRDGQPGPVRPDNLYIGTASFDPQPDWVDMSKVSIPQADEQQRLLANLILKMNLSKKPLPRFWYFPSGFKAAVVMTGDDHEIQSATAHRFDDFLAASPAGCSVADWQCVRSSSYLAIGPRSRGFLTESQVSRYNDQGFEISIHIDSVPSCSDVTVSQLDASYTDSLAFMAAQFPGLPSPHTLRRHCVGWGDYDSQPRVELKHGIRFDTDYYYWPPSWVKDRPGMFTGSGIPMRFADRNGNPIDVYQAATEMTDESGQSFPWNIDTLLDNAIGPAEFYGAFVANMHNDLSGGGAWKYPGPGANQIVASARARGVPVVSSQQMLTWLDGRNASSYGSLLWRDHVLSFNISIGRGARNLFAMLPVNSADGTLSDITFAGKPVNFTVESKMGVSYAIFTASTGAYKAVYGGGGGGIANRVLHTHRDRRQATVCSLAHAAKC